MSKIAIVTDSTATIPESLLGVYPVHVAPLQVIWDGKSYRDGIDIKNEDFYIRLKSAKEMPSTSQVSPNTFRELYEQLLREDNEVVSIHISSALSGTMDSAIQAKQMLPGARIELIDSKLTSMALGFVVLHVAKAAQSGATLAECVMIARRSCEQAGALFSVSTLEFLHRGGRIGGAAAFLGTALNLKPLLELKDGRIEAIERVRTTAKAIDRMIDLFVMRVGNRTPIRVAGLHANAKAEAELVLEKVRARFNTSDVSEAVISEISPVLGTHTGPGTIGLAYLVGM